MEKTYVSKEKRILIEKKTNNTFLNKMKSDPKIVMVLTRLWGIMGLHMALCQAFNTDFL
jgi:hypothetical protein